MAELERQPFEEDNRAELEGFGASRHWGGYGSDRPDRGLAEKLSDEVRSWMGDEAATRRRREDKAHG